MRRRNALALYFLLLTAAVCFPNHTLAVTVNYRSIGTDTGVLYSAGDASISAGSQILTFGNGANLPSHVGTGDVLQIGSQTFHILSRDSAICWPTHSRPIA